METILVFLSQIFLPRCQLSYFGAVL